MVEMHAFQEARRVEISAPSAENDLPAQSLLALIYEVQEWFSVCPRSYCGGRAESRSVYVLFDNVMFSADDFWQRFDEPIAALRNRWQIDILGTAVDSQETVWMSLSEEAEHIYMIQRTLSGQAADTLESLCFRIQCESHEESRLLHMITRETDWQGGIIAVDWKYRPFLQGEEQAVPQWNSCFCYETFLEDPQAYNYIGALNFEKKISLWISCLRDGLDYIEFEWLFDAIFQNELINRMEWELALHMAMEQLGYRIAMTANAFELYDSQGKRRYFSFDSTQYAERVFLKILYPINL